MSPIQRRALWLCIFALAFILWYEASGHPLTWQTAPAEPLRGVEARSHYWEQFRYGLFILGMGALLTVLLRPRDKPVPYAPGDWLALAAGLGLLIGTALRSWHALLP